MKLKSIIVDDEKLSRDLLREMILDTCPGINVIAEASSKEEATDVIGNLHPDVVFMDIEMQGSDCFDWLSQIRLSNSLQVVFITGYTKYSARAMKAGGVDYLLKPIDVNELKCTTSRLVHNHIDILRNNIHFQSESLNTKLAIPHFGSFKIVTLRDIVQLDADNHYTHIHLSNEPSSLLSISIRHFEEKLDNFWFFRLHKSHLINLYHLRGYLSEDGGYALMSNGNKVPVSNLKTNDFFERISTLGIRI